MLKAVSSTKRTVVYPLLVGQLSLAVELIVCFILRPQFLQSEGGFSNYGVVAVTIPFFTGAFLTAAIGTYVAARRVRQNSMLKWSLYILAILFLSVLISTYPYKLNALYDLVHKLMAIVFSVWQLFFAIWLTIKVHDAVSLMCFGIQVVATIMAGITLLGFVHLLFVSELLASASFGVLLVWAVGAMGKNPHRKL